MWKGNTLCGNKAAHPVSGPGRIWLMKGIMEWRNIATGDTCPACANYIIPFYSQGEANSTSSLDLW